MLRQILIVFVLLFFAFPQQVNAFYDPLSVPNNLFGIHILETAELEPASKYINSAGGDWGYVTIPIRANDRDLSRWIKFMQDATRLHVIPILRLASFAVEDHWMAPNEYDLIDFANFLDELPWPTQNRYVIVYNEPNHKNEWGGFLYPEEYALVLSRAIDIFHQKNADFFVISAGFDSSAPNGMDSMNEYDYLHIMNARFPGIFNWIDGFSSHSYGNPGFSSFPSLWSSISIANYHFEENFLSVLGVSRPKIFITEAGWNNDLIGELAASNFYQKAFRETWTDNNIVAVTPFVFSAQAGPFTGFSFLDKNGNLKPFAKDLQQIPKTAGQPQLAKIRTNIDKDKITPIETVPVTQSISPITRLWNGLLHLISKSE